jgi:hypothetical membrane protein
MKRFRSATWASSLAGVLAVVVALGSVLLATLLSPSFTWTGHALSNLGGRYHPASTSTTRLVFNYGLMAGGLLGSGFGYALYRAYRNRVELLGIVSFGVTLLFMALVGVFPQHRDPHMFVAVAFYTVLSLALWTYGVGNLLAGASRRGAVTVGLGAVNAGSWAVWAVTGDVSRGGVAIPEIVGALIFGGWALATVQDVHRRLTRTSRRTG